MDDAEPPFRSLDRDGRRLRILLAAKRVMVERGLDAASMDDVAARAGTTKPTVYAHFGSKDELFAAVVGLVEGLFAGSLRDPSAYADEPIEAVARFCARYAEMASWRDCIAYQRAALGAVARSPEIPRAVHDTLHAAASRTLAGYLRDRRLTARPGHFAGLLLAATAGEAVLRHLFGVDESAPDRPDEAAVGDRVDLASIREAVRLIAAGWGR